MSEHRPESSFSAATCAWCPMARRRANQWQRHETCQCGVVHEPKPRPETREPMPRQRYAPDPRPTEPMIFAALEPRPNTHPDRSNRSPRLRLLEDCAEIAKWDSIVSPKSIVPRRPDEGFGSPGARPEATDLPDWRLDSLDETRVAAGLRSRLDAIWSRGRAAPMQLIAWLAWCVQIDACRIAGQTNAPAWPLPPPMPEVLALRAAAVIEWLVPRARTIMASVGGQKGVVGLKSLPRDVGRAFASAEQIARWHPAVPVKPAVPSEPVAPPWHEWAHWMNRRRYHREVGAYVAACEAHAVRVAESAKLTERYDEQVRRYPRFVEAGRVGEECYGNELLMLAERAWFDAGR